jgi:hypothetical protein
VSCTGREDGVDRGMAVDEYSQWLLDDPTEVEREI